MPPDQIMAQPTPDAALSSAVAVHIIGPPPFWRLGHISAYFYDTITKIDAVAAAARELRRVRAACASRPL
jgi:hypothetical protein